MTNQIPALLEERAVNASCSDVRAVPFFSLPPPPTTVSPDTHPLGTYETKMTACTGKRSILTILRKNRDCEQSSQI